MTDQIEVERKWRLLEPPTKEWLSAFPAQRLTQAYILTDPGELRIRSDGTTSWMTVKSDGTIARSEWEVEIPAWVFAQLLAATDHVITKTRYTVPGDMRKWELDVYEGALEGLVIVEAEYCIRAGKTEEELAETLVHIRDSRLYPGFGSAIEVTDDKRYKNKNLALFGIPNKEEKA
ncbi:adenylate cyclase [bacterium]|nr:adenylate cyclase [bacterium]